jgi:TolA-binding protein
VTVLVLAGTACGSLLAILALVAAAVRWSARMFRVAHRFVSAVTDNTAALERVESMLSNHVRQTEHRLTSVETRVDALNGRVDTIEQRTAAA